MIFKTVFAGLAALAVAADGAYATDDNKLLKVDIRTDLDSRLFEYVQITINESAPDVGQAKQIYKSARLAASRMTASGGLVSVLQLDWLYEGDFYIRAEFFNEAGVTIKDQTRRINMRDEDNYGIVFAMDTVGDARLAIELLIDRDGDGLPSFGDLAKITTRVRDLKGYGMVYRDDFSGGNLVLCPGTVRAENGEVVLGNNRLHSTVEIDFPEGNDRGWKEISYSAVFAPIAIAQGVVSYPWISVDLPTNDQRTIAKQDPTRQVLGIDRTAACTVAVSTSPQIIEKLRTPRPKNFPTLPIERQ